MASERRPVTGEGSTQDITHAVSHGARASGFGPLAVWASCRSRGLTRSHRMHAPAAPERKRRRGARGGAHAGARYGAEEMCSVRHWIEEATSVLLRMRARMSSIGNPRSARARSARCVSAYTLVCSSTCAFL